MKSIYLTFLSVIGILAVVTSESAAQGVYGIDSGVTSIRLAKPALDSLGFVVSGSTDSVPPAEGYDIGFQISTSTKPKDKFCFTLDPFTPGEGIIEHTGTVDFASGMSLGNFEIAFDSSRFDFESKSGFFITDRTALLDGTVLFDIGHQASDTINGSEFTWVDSDLLIAPEFATILGNAGLAGTDVGDVRIDGIVGLKAVPEPSSALLLLFGGSFLTFRRKRA